MCILNTKEDCTAGNFQAINDSNKYHLILCKRSDHCDCGNILELDEIPQPFMAIGRGSVWEGGPRGRGYFSLASEVELRHL